MLGFVFPCLVLLLFGHCVVLPFQTVAAKLLVLFLCSSGFFIPFLTELHRSFGLSSTAALCEIILPVLLFLLCHRLMWFVVMTLCVSVSEKFTVSQKLYWFSCYLNLIIILSQIMLLCYCIYFYRCGLVDVVLCPRLLLFPLFLLFCGSSSFICELKFLSCLVCFCSRGFTQEYRTLVPHGT